MEGRKKEKSYRKIEKRSFGKDKGERKRTSGHVGKRKKNEKKININ